MDKEFPKYLPTIIEHCLVIPLITLMLTYGVYIIIGGIVLGGLFIGIERNNMVDQILIQEGIGAGIVVLMVAILFIFGFLDKLGKQRTQAKEIEIKMTYGYEPTVKDKLDMAKVENVNMIYKIALVFGIVVASVLGVIAVHFVLIDKIESEFIFYLGCLGLAFIDYLMVEYAVWHVANGEFEKCKQEMLEQFRKVEEVPATPNADLSGIVADLQVQFAGLSTALQGIANAVKKP